MSALLVAAAFFSALMGIASLTQATQGVGFLSAACLLGIFARIAQAAAHHADVKAMHHRDTTPTPPAP